MEIEYKKTAATLTMEINCKCPNCGDYLDLFHDDGIRSELRNDHNAINCNIEVECEQCNEIFILTDIYF